jgi:hypothetical protein
MIDFEKTSPDLKELLGRRISQLGLKVEGSPIERSVEKLRKELVKKGIKCFKAVVYLTDEWGCPSGEPVIGVPFYLADPQLAKLERSMNDLESEREILMYLPPRGRPRLQLRLPPVRHPRVARAVRAVQPPLPRRLQAGPRSRASSCATCGLVRAEAPGRGLRRDVRRVADAALGWRDRYRGWPALAKLRYIDRIVKKFGNVEPVVGKGDTDITVEEMELTVEEFYRQVLEQNRAAGRPRHGRRPARHVHPAQSAAQEPALRG